MGLTANGVEVLERLRSGYKEMSKEGGTFLLDKWTSSCSVFSKPGKIVDSAWKVMTGLLKKVQL